jgi:hypothetical protein
LEILLDLPTLQRLVEKEVRKDAFRLHCSVYFKKLYTGDILPSPSFALRFFAAVFQTDFLACSDKNKTNGTTILEREVSQFVD